MRRFAMFAFAVVFTSGSVMAAGFQVAAQGARAMGMGLAYTAVADDATAIYFNPAGLAFQGKGEALLGIMGAGNTEGTFDSARGREEQQTGLTAIFQLHAYDTFGAAKVGIGVFTPFGLPMKWENPSTFSGRFSSHTAILKTLTINPTVAFKVTPNLGVGVGFDYMFSKIQLERFIPLSAATPVNIAHAKISSDLLENHGTGWNVGIKWTSGAMSLGAAYRSSIDVDHDAKAKFNALVPGVPLPATPIDASAEIEFPSMLNLGAAWKFGSATIAFDADRTDWSSFDSLEIVIPALGPQPARPNDWQDTWAYRVGAEFNCGPIKCRAGYFRDQTPMPLKDVGPILPDADRNGYALGIGWQGSKFGIDIADNYVKFEKRTTDATNTDHLIGTYRTTGNELAVNVNWHW